MESPVVLDKPPEYHGGERGFPFDEEEGSGAWSELASRHPDIAARLRQRPATWARKRRPSSQDATDDFGDGFGGFDRFPFDDIPPEFREHFPSHWNRRFGPRDEQPQPQPTQQHVPHPPQSPPAQQQTAATQTEQEPQPGPSEPEPQTHLPQYGLRNTVDLGQKSPADPSLVDADDRNQRSMSAPPDSSAPSNQSFKMSGQNHQEHPPQHGEQHSNVRHIPIFVEGRDEPVINKSVDHGTHFGETKPAYVPPPPQPHIDREQYFADDGPVGYHHPPNFSRAFGTPFNKGFRQGPQPFTQQKAYPQAAFARGASPQRAQSPKPQPPPHTEEHFVKVPVHHEQNAPKTDPPSRTQQRPPQQQQPAPPPQQKQAPPQPQAPQREQTPPQPKQTPVNDPITQILRIQTDVLNLMTEVENFGGAKNDKKYLFLDEMLTRNLIKLDTIETDGKENIRQARKEAIKCIQKCIAVLEAKAESNAADKSQPQQTDVEMNENTDTQQAAEQVTENGEVEMKENTKEEGQGEPQEQAEQPAQVAPAVEAKTEKPQEVTTEAKVEEVQAPAEPADNKDASQTQAADTRPEDTSPEKPAENIEQKPEGEDKSPKKGTKVVKKRNKSKENKKDIANDSTKPEDSNKEEKVEEKKENLDIMQVDDKGDKSEPQVMEVDGAASQ